MTEESLIKINSKEELEKLIAEHLNHVLSREYLDKKLIDAIVWTRENLPKIIPKTRGVLIDYKRFYAEVDSDTEIYSTDCECGKYGKIIIYKKPLINSLRFYYSYLSHGRKPFVRKLDIESMFVHEIVEYIEMVYLGRGFDAAHQTAGDIEDINRKMRRVDSEPAYCD